MEGWRVRCFPALTLHARAHLRHLLSTHHISLTQYTRCLLTLSASFHVFSTAFPTLQAPPETLPLLACVLLAIAPTEGAACAWVHNKIIFALGGRNSADTPWQFHLPWEKQRKREKKGGTIWLRHALSITHGSENRCMDGSQLVPTVLRSYTPWIIANIVWNYFIIIVLFL